MTTTTMTTTDRARPRRRWSKDAVRAVAWATGAATFLGSVAAIAVVPKPAVADPQAARAPRQRLARPVIERHVTRRIVVITPAAPSTPVTVVQAPTGGVASAPAPAPAPAPVTSSGGS